MSIENAADWQGLKEAGRIVQRALAAMRRRVRPGVTTADLDAVGAEVILRHGARSAPNLVYGFPGANCISVNEEVVHGVPGGRVVQAGDLVKLDVTVEKDGYMADAAVSVPVPPVSAEVERLVACARTAFFKGLEAARPGRRVHEIGRAVEREVERRGFTVLRDLSGHGIGRTIHEAPSVPNFDDRSCREVLTEGLVFTIEPLIARNTRRSVTTADGWTVRTANGSLSAHYEHTLVVTRSRPFLLTAAA